MVSRYCSCRTALAADNQTGRCSACAVSARKLACGPPLVPATFWQADRIRDALAARDMGALIAAYRTHPYHGQPIRQDAAAGWLGVSQSQLSRIERGLTRVDDIGRLVDWGGDSGRPRRVAVDPSCCTRPGHTEVVWRDEPGQGSANRAGVGETWDMNRRNLLRLAAAATTLAASRPHRLPGSVRAAASVHGRWR
ncbi:hypothetical protein ABZS66_12260 [Dactylosporangium sp. NPDC005572]|uniref:hypothetical protein n=1 Tax=Dactylosporangium sp. NPDC005572 TaxID=3156889 RepID=UPI0033AA5221